MEHNRNPGVASEHDGCPELAELDRILADIKAEEERCKIATDSTAADQAVSQDMAGIAVPDRTSKPVDTLPLTPTITYHDLGEGGEAAVAIPFKERTTRLQETVERLFPSLDKPWRHHWAHEKLAQAFMAVEAAQGATFNLHLSAKIQKTLCNHLDPARLMAHYIRRKLRAQFGECPPFGFAFDVSDKGRLHLHGAIIPLAMEEEHLNALDKALMAAGGRMKGARIVRQMQNYMNVCYDGIGWAAYSQKNFDEAVQFLGTRKVTFISNSLKRLCRPEYSSPSGHLGSPAYKSQ
ncbi:MAG TPA: hypothetical protein VHC00_04515 [Rhizobiaceae bacterium]|nr:hypothetical protein [Rhizobiaceae bacterium]